jgi:hypothetical protein
MSGLSTWIDTNIESSLPPTGDIIYDLSGNGNDWSLENTTGIVRITEGGVNLLEFIKADGGYLDYTNYSSSNPIPTGDDGTIQLIYEFADSSFEVVFTASAAADAYFIAKNTSDVFYNGGSLGSINYFVDDVSSTSAVIGSFAFYNFDITGWTPNGNLWLGNYGNSANIFSIGGKLRAILIYDRILSAGEQTQNYNAYFP